MTQAKQEDYAQFQVSVAAKPTNVLGVIDSTSWKHGLCKLSTILQLRKERTVTIFCVCFVS